MWKYVYVRVFCWLTPSTRRLKFCDTWRFVHVGFTSWIPPHLTHRKSVTIETMYMSKPSSLHSLFLFLGGGGDGKDFREEIFETHFEYLEYKIFPNIGCYGFYFPNTVLGCLNSCPKISNGPYSPFRDPSCRHSKQSQEYLRSLQVAESTAQTPFLFRMLRSLWGTRWRRRYWRWILCTDCSEYLKQGDSNLYLSLFNFDIS